MSQAIVGVDLTDKDVLLQAKFFKPGTNLVFHCEDGFGCKPYLSGQAVCGHWVSDGETCRVERFMVERLATPEEVAAAQAIRQQGEGHGKRNDAASR